MTRASGLPAVFLVAAAAGVAQSFGRFAFGVVLPAVRADLGLSNTVAGTLTSLNVGAYLAGTFAVAALASSWKLLRMMRVGFVLALAGLGLAAVAPGTAAVGAAMILSGFGGAMIWIPAPVIAAAALPPERRSLAIGLLGSGMGVGIVFASQLSSWVRSSMGDESWRTVYVVLVAISAVVVLATVLLVGYDEDQLAAKRSGFGGIAALKRLRAWLPLTAAYTTFGLMYLLVMAFLTTRLEDDSGWSSSHASLAFTLVGVAVMFGGPLFIAIARRVGTRLALAVAFASWAVVVLLILPGWLALALPASVLLGLLFAAIPTVITVYVVENAAADDYAPAFAAATIAFGIAQIVSPQLGGFVADLTGSFTAVFVLSAALGLCGFLASLRLPRNEASAAA